MFHNQLLFTLNDIAESLKIIAKRETDFPISLKQSKEITMQVTSSNLGSVVEERQKQRQEEIDKQVNERGEGFFFVEDSVDEDLITGGFVR